MNCPDRNLLLAFRTGELTETTAEEVISHLGVCSDCQATLRTFGDADDTLGAKLRSPPVEDPYKDEPQQAELMKRAMAIVTGGPPLSDRSPTETPLAASLGRLGEYELLAKLGEGGMGAVYKACQTRLRKVVAIKVLPRERAADPQAVTRFEREMEAVGQLSHPNIVQAYDARDIDATTVLVMEYVDGKDLGDLLKRVKSLHIPDACEVVRQTALGLQYVHEHGLVHRDIKPSNLMLTRQGQVKILDLGLARPSAEKPEGNELTGTGVAMGTADYMAPEQVSDAHTVDIRADIYGLGCTFYKLLTGQAPFSGPQYKTAAEKLVGHLKETPPPVQLLRSDTPPELVAVIERMMAKSPDDRFATPAEVAAAIAPFAAGCDLAKVSAQAAAEAGGCVAREMSPGATEPYQPRAPHWFDDVPKLWIAVGGAMLFAVVLLGALIKLRTREGTLIVEVDDPGTIVQVLNEKSEVVLERKGEKGSVTIGIAPGRGRLRLLKDGVELFAQEFSLVAGGQETIKARLEPPITSPYSRSTTHFPAVGSLIGPDGKWKLPPGAPPPAIAPFDAAKAKEHQEAWAKNLGVPVEMTNAIGMKLVLIPPGEFMMGEPGKDWHKVKITKPFYLGKYEVTQEEWEKVMGFGSNPSQFKGPNNPVETVSWEDCQVFLEGLNQRYETQQGGYLLPTESQWEYACRAGTTGKWYFGENEAAFGEFAWYRENSEKKTHAVGEKKPNAWGLYDMHGNVWEWCADWFDEDYYNVSPLKDPAGPPPDPKRSHRVFRGGSWIGPAGDCLSAFRGHYEPGRRHNYLGLRVCLVLPSDPEELKKFAAALKIHASQPPAVAPLPPGAWPADSPVGKPGAPPPAVAPFDAAKAKEHQAAWAKYLGVPVEITNSIGMKLMLIPPGEFMMGSPKELIDDELKTAPKDDKWYLDRLPSEGPRHHVRITRPFYLGIYPVTQEEYQKVMGANPSEFSATGKSKDKVTGQDTKRFPVETVSWQDADEFCSRLAEIAEEKSAGRRYRLPLEAQWEYACRVGSTGRYFFGPVSDDKNAAENLLPEYAWFSDNADGRLHAVGGRRASPWGLYDMNGNVWQWCQDWHANDYYLKSPTDDPAGPPGGSLRVIRGGSWFNPARLCRSATRGNFELGIRILDVGFRVCLVLPEEPENIPPEAKAPSTQYLVLPPPLTAPHPAVASLEPQTSAHPPAAGSLVGPDGKWKLPPGAPPPAVAPFDTAKAQEHQAACARRLGVPVEMTNSIGMKLILIPPGEFEMGSPPELIDEELKIPGSDQYADRRYKEHLPDEGPQHRVRITRPFYLGTYLVTQQEYQRLMGTNPSEYSATGNGKDKVAGQETKRFPVERVSWDDAVEFCRKLSNLPEEKKRRQGGVIACPARRNGNMPAGRGARVGTALVWAAKRFLRNTTGPRFPTTGGSKAIPMVYRTPSG